MYGGVADCLLDLHIATLMACWVYYSTTTVYRLSSSQSLFSVHRSPRPPDGLTLLLSHFPHFRGASLHPRVRQYINAPCVA